MTLRGKDVKLINIVKMTKTAKTIISIVIFIVMIIILSALNASKMRNGGAIGGLSMFTIFGAVGAVAAIWKSKTKSSGTQTATKPMTVSQATTTGSTKPLTSPTALLSDDKFKNESMYDRLKRLCYPANFMGNYDKEKVDTANSIYSRLMALNPENEIEIDELCQQAESQLGINLLDEYRFNKLKNAVNPENYMEPYDSEKITIANELYSRLLRPQLNYSAFMKIKSDAEPLVEYYTEMETIIKQKAYQQQQIQAQERQQQQIQAQKLQQQQIQAQKLQQIQNADNFFIIITVIIGAIILCFLLKDRW